MATQKNRAWVGTLGRLVVSVMISNDYTWQITMKDGTQRTEYISFALEKKPGFMRILSIIIGAVAINVGWCTDKYVNGGYDHELNKEPAQMDEP